MAERRAQRRFRARSSTVPLDRGAARLGCQHAEGTGRARHLDGEQSPAGNDCFNTGGHGNELMRTRGFTLLELLLAIALMALISGTLYASLFVGIRAHRSATSTLEAPRSAALAFELLRQDFDGALPPNGVL